MKYYGKIVILLLINKYCISKLWGKVEIFKVKHIFSQGHWNYVDFMCQNVSFQNCYFLSNFQS